MGNNFRRIIDKKKNFEIFVKNRQKQLTIVWNNAIIYRRVDTNTEPISIMRV